MSPVPEVAGSVSTTRRGRTYALIVAPIAALILSLAGMGAPASAATPAIYHSYHLYNKLDTRHLANCPYTNHIYSQLGTATFSSPYDYANVKFYDQWVGNLHYLRYYQEGFTTAIVNLGCVNNDFVDMYYGYSMTYRIQYITYNCYSGGCSAAVSYSAWMPGWAVIP